MAQKESPAVNIFYATFLGRKEVWPLAAFLVFKISPRKAD
jgi:hypothetical protein